MPQTKFSLLPGVAIATLVLMCGCGGAPDDGYQGPRGSVSGTISVDGSPVPAGTKILFQSTSEGYVATGEVEEEGHYSVSHQGSQQVPAVTYQIQLTPPPAPEAPPSEEPAIGPAPIVQNDLPFSSQYLSVTTSELTFTVKEGNNTADFELKK